jgi:hypothetical protein
MEENDPTYYDDNYGMEKPEEEVTHYFTLTDDELQTARELASKYPNIYVGKTAVQIGGKMASPGNVAVTGPKNEVENFEKDMEDLDSESMQEENLDY